MKPQQKKVRALGLSSGGLDSILSAMVLKAAGIECEWITFETPFFSSGKARNASKITGIPLTVKNITDIYMEMLIDPPCGYGRHMNPCMDCHALMFGQAGIMMKEKGFDFLFSGEVLNQRPMSQTRSSLRYVEKHSGFDGYIVRPLSGRLLPETIPEKEGLIHRDGLLDLAGRSRKPQIALARKYNIKTYPSPAGGCLLTDAEFSRRLKDLFDHQDAWTENELHLLKYGRHFRLSDAVKLIVGRKKAENELIQKLADPDKDFIFKTQSMPGPLALMTGGGPDPLVFLAATICAGYTKASEEEAVSVNMWTPAGSKTISALKVPHFRLKHLLI